MGKAKKGKRSGKDEDMESDVDMEEQSVTDPVKSKAKGKESKKKNNKVSDDVDDLANDMEDLKVEKPKEKKGKKGKKVVNDESEDEMPVKSRGKGKKATMDDDDFGSDTDTEVKPKAKTKKGKKNSFSDEELDIIPVKGKQKGGKGGFSFLEIEGDDNDDDDENEVPPSEDDSEKVQSVERPKGNKGKGNQKQEPQVKKGKKSRKKYDSDEELERELAALEMEYAGQKVEPAESAVAKKDEEEKEVKKKVSEEKPKKAAETKEKDQDNEEGGSTVKTAAQKKKEKKEREKQKKLAQKKAEVGKKPESGETTKEPSVEKSEVAKKVVEETTEQDEDDEDGKKKKKKGAKEDVKGKKGPAKKAILAMQEALRLAKEEEERVQREEEERIRQEELAEAARLAQIQLEQERKEKKKLKEKQRKERLKAEGKFFTEKQKQDRARAQQLLESLKAQGLEIPEAGQKKTRAKPTGKLTKPNKLKQQSSTEDKKEDDNTRPEQVELEIIDQQKQEQAKEADKKTDEVKDSWDADSSEEEAEEDKSEEAPKPEPINKVTGKNNGKTPVSKKNVESSESESESGSDSDSDSDDDSDESIDERLTDAEKKKERARLRIQNRRNSAEKNRTIDNLRAAVVCVLGHVDTGKTKILDKLRRTNVQDGEAGGITQQIGATNVPIDAIRESTRHVKGFADKTLKIPGLLIIDTPGHESFSNLRNRGSSLCDIAVLVIDIMHGLEQQTIESINILKSKKCPFVVALNKIDRLYDWETMNRKDVYDIINAQGISTKLEFEKRSKDIILQLAEQGLNAALFYENPDPRSYVSLVPTSAITGEGMGNLLALLVDACQGPLAKRLMYSDELQATVLEVKQLPGHGTTIDCILVNGTLREGDTMVVAGTDGPIVTQIRALLMPQPLKELRVKNSYVEYREIKAAQGVKITAKDLEKAIAGLNLAIAHKPDEVELLKEEISQELSKALGSMKISERGVFVQASTLGALEALLDFLRSSKIPYAGIRIGPVVKKDVMKASIMLEHDSQYATILAFDVKIERDAQDLADTLGVKIFQADIIYHLFDKFMAYREELKQRMRDEHKHIAVFPCKLRVLPQFIFNSRDPIVVGVMVEAGIVKEGTPVCVPSKDFVDLGVVTSVEYNHKPVESARKGQEVCIKIEPIPGEAPKMFGRHFDEKDMIISKISRQSIDACKNYFRDDLLKPDWHLMVELKKLFEIL